jgi:hypothetical protein
MPWRSQVGRESISHEAVILSGEMASHSEAIAESKDPYLRHEFVGSREFRRLPQGFRLTFSP